MEEWKIKISKKYPIVQFFIPTYYLFQKKKRDKPVPCIIPNLLNYTITDFKNTFKKIDV